MGLEKAIWREEQQVPAPAPALSFAAARLEALNTDIQAAEERVAVWNRSGGGGSDESLRQVVLELGIHRDEHKAAEHEEFIATINRQVHVRPPQQVARAGKYFYSDGISNVASPAQVIQGDSKF
jgi:hypothetical protein